MAELTAIIGEADAQKFLEYCKGNEDGSVEPGTLLELDSDFSDKAKRTEVHQYFKKALTKYESDTLSVGESRKVRVFFKEGFSKKKRQKLDIMNKWGNPNFGGQAKMPEYLSVALQKTNVESIQAIHYISKRTKKQMR